MKTSEPQPVCEHGGSPKAEHIGDHWLCVDCYEAAGSCCIEFGGDDLWQERDEPAPPTGQT